MTIIQQMQNPSHQSITSFDEKQQSIAQTIKLETMIRFSTQFKAKFKKDYHTSNVYTVICSIGFINKITNQIQIVAVANGTKSLPYSIYQQNQRMIIKDMHAEILAIKAFRKFIANQIVEINPSKYLKKDVRTNKFIFNLQDYQIFMYSSQPFCGDCSVEESNGLFSGAKPLIHFGTNQMPNEKFQKHILRTKPGRMDLPQQKKSLSLSCSDKLALYNILGIQGKQLFQQVIPIYIDIFIVQSSSSQFNNKSMISEGLNFIHRLGKLKSWSQQLVKRKIFKIYIEKKYRRISNQFKSQHQPKILCYRQKISHQSYQQNVHSLNLQNNNCGQFINNNKKKQKQGFQLSLIDSNGYVQWINSKTGLPQGSSLSNYKKKGKLSQFSKQKFLEYLQKSNIYQSQTFDQTFKYDAIKNRIKLLFGIWTDSFKQVSFPKNNQNQLPNNNICIV